MSGGVGSNSGGGGGGDIFCLLILLKSRSAREPSNHPAFMATAQLLVTGF